jgi:hypothetical protein
LKDENGPIAQEQGIKSLGWVEEGGESCNIFERFGLGRWIKILMEGTNGRCKRRKAIEKYKRYILSDQSNICKDDDRSN